MNAEIRTLDEEDAAVFQVLRLRALREHPESFAQSYESQAATPIHDVRERLRDVSEAPHDFILGMFSGCDLIGMVGFRRHRGVRMQHKGDIWGMYVVAEAQGHGLGKLMIQNAIERAGRIPRLKQINLAVVSSNTAARNLYLSLGFQVYGLEKRSAFVNGKYLDDEYMTLFLDQ